MATSGTVAQTVLDTATVLEHAVRRCGVQASLQTPEIAQVGKQNLYLLLLNLANRGLNLWCVERNILGTEANRAKYVLPAGTLRLLNVLYGTSTRLATTDTVAAASFSSAFDTATVRRYGFKPAATVTCAFSVEANDGTGWTAVATHASQEWVAGTWYWFDTDPSIEGVAFRISSATNFSLDEFYLTAAFTELPMTQFNRDEYAQQPVKYYTQDRSTNFYFDKVLGPTITLWPVPNSDYGQIVLWRYRYIQDVGSLPQQIEVPLQWTEAVIWMLAARLAFELPGINPALRQEVQSMADRYMLEAETSETDNAPIYLVPGIGVYTA